MTRLALDFVKRRRVPWVGMIVFLLMAAISANRFWIWMDIRSQVERDEARIAMLQERLSARTKATAEETAKQGQIWSKRHDEETKVLDELRYPWNCVLSTLEQAQTEGVAVLSFTHDAKTKESRITVEALDVAQIVLFVDKLNGGNGAEAGEFWYLSSQQVQSQGTPRTVVGVILHKK